MPELFIVIGANGAGKTTWADANRQDLPSHFYNADSIASGLGSADEAQHQLAARGIVDRAIAQHLLRQESFGFESTYSGRSRPGIVRQAKRLGYHTYAVFLGTEHPEINIERVRQRVLWGGHDVPTTEITRRWSRARENLIATWDAFDQVDLVDNSGQTAKLVATQPPGRIATGERPPKWASDILSAVTQPGGDPVPGTIPRPPKDGPSR